MINPAVFALRSTLLATTFAALLPARPVPAADLAVDATNGNSPYPLTAADPGLNLGTLSIGSPTTGVFNQSGSSVTAGRLFVGAGTGAQGTYNQTGGTASFTNVFIGLAGASGTYTLTDFAATAGASTTLLEANGILDINGGSFNTGGLSNAPGTAPTVRIANNGIGGRALTVGTGNASSSFNGTIVDSTIRAGSLVKNGSGVFELTGANTYTGGTTINAGLLLANNTAGSATGSGTLTIQNTPPLGAAGIGVLGGGAGASNGGTLNPLIAGTYRAGQVGVVTGAITVNSGGKLAPGNGVGTLTLGSLTLAAGAQLDFEFSLSSSTHDFVRIDNLGGLNIQGATGFNLVLENSTTAFGTPGLYHLLGYNGAFSGNTANLSVLNPVVGETYTFLNNPALQTIDLLIAPSPVPEPGTWAIVVSGLLTLLGVGSRQRRNRLRRGGNGYPKLAIRHGFLLIAFPALLASCGKNADNAKSPTREQTADAIRLTLPGFLQLDQVETDPIAVEPGKVTVKFKATLSPKEDLYLIDRENSPSGLELLKVSEKAGTKTTLYGSVDAERAVDHWTFAQPQFDNTAGKFAGKPRASYGADVYVAGSPEATQEIARREATAKRQREAAAEVAAKRQTEADALAEKKRQETETAKSRFFEAIRPGIGYEGIAIFDYSKGIQQISLRIVEQNGGVVTAESVNREKPAERRRFTGEARFDSVHPEASEIVLAPTDSLEGYNTNFFQEKGPLTLKPSATGLEGKLNHRFSVRLQKAASRP